MHSLLEIFPFIKETKLELEKQNKFLNKVTLTGKINALKEAGNLFEFTDRTVSIFSKLNIELIDALINENLNKITNELNSKTQTTIDILIRNLFERTADIGFLATDSVIIDFLRTDSISFDSMKKRLNEYIEKYSVYNEVIIFDVDANVKVNINSSNIICSSKDLLIQEALESESYIEVYKKTDIFKTQHKTLIYAQKITYNSQPIGVLCLCFKLENELESIFNKLSTNNDILAIADKKGLIFSNTKKLNFETFNKKEYTIINNRYLSTTAKATGYQGYNGISDWYAIAQMDTKEIKINGVLDSKELKTYYSLLNKNLVEIIDRANDLVDDISDVIINGELIAAKQKIYVLTPILDNLRDISATLLETIKSSVHNLQLVVKESLIHDIEMTSLLTIDIMDRNLYERANDCRWWALTPIFEEELSSKNPNISKLNETLSYINKLYTVYTDIFLFDESGTIVASSNTKDIIGDTLRDEYISKTLNNKNSQYYFVSEFQNTKLYGDRATYIYSASINSNNKTYGIGLVFDSQPEFQAILNDSFPKNKKGFSVFVDSNRKIISSNSNKHNLLGKLEIDEKHFQNIKNNIKVEFIRYKDINYIISIVISKGYREYKNSDNYRNIVYAVSFIEI